jgi:FSR family fosmidomycin resistance protein-like MFS transporter
MSDERETNGGRFQTGHAVTLTCAHFVHDVFTAFLAPLLPLLIEKLSISLQQAGWLDFFARIPSVFNPLIGSAIDRGGYSRALVILAPAISGITMCLTGLAPSYTSLVVLLLTCGVSVAALHVSAPVIMSEISGDHVGRGMSFFMVGGELARVSGPIIAVQAVSWFDLEGLWRVIPASLVASLVLWWRLARIPVGRRPQRPTGLLTLWKRMRRVILAIFGILIARSFMVAMMTTFLPTYITSQGHSLVFASYSLAVFELAGAAGVIVGGMLSDRVGRRSVLLASTVLSPLLTLVFLHAEGSQILPVLAALGFVVLATTPVMMAAMIENSGDNPAVANGTFMMMAFAIRSVFAVVVGALGDAIGMYDTYFVCAALAALGIPFVFLLPRKQE